MSDNALVCDALTVQYQRGGQPFTAVNQVSFAIPRGGAFGLIGGSGCGKSSILRVLAGLDAHWQGRLQVMAVERRNGSRPPAHYPKLLQMVFQDPYGSLHPRHTIDRVIGEPLRVQGFDRIEQRIVEALQQVGLDARFRFRYPHQLSGGQRQRVAIARAIALQPAVLLLDEPTSALDASVQAEILNLLMELRAALQTTYLFVSHDLAVVAHLCDQVAVMQGGMIVETLSATQLAEGAATHPYTLSLLQESGLASASRPHEALPG
ncbi:ABC transporter ATP-binding protein [Leeia aquatica]|uniref:Glutathione import ATP-binding protein GsiA n=1 Tax=Leeia aquatica TaxID=2725557 RepID=A0A847SAM1_9NEIS|nr:ABC transporter ATP-binding protein [Leeia aquatica]NLR75945.1 ABC transporter ATP-binding protein [Leeia aquatica]